MAAMTTFVKASLFLDSVVGSSGCSEMVETRDRFDRLFCDSDNPFRLSGLTSVEMLGERDNGLEAGRDVVPFADGGRKSGWGEVFISIESDFRCPAELWDSVPRAAAAAMLMPPFAFAFLLAIVATSNMSRLRLGDPEPEVSLSVVGKNWASTPMESVLLKAGDVGKRSTAAP
jgi:hypothetical protein